MKKIAMLLLALPLIGIMAACHDDDDMPQVNITTSYTNGTVVDNVVYVVSPDTLYVDSVQVKAVRPNKVATNGAVSYFLNGAPLGTSFFPPYGAAIPTANLREGAYTLSLSMTVAEEGCELSSVLASIKVNVVDDASKIPTSAGGERNSMPVEFQFK